MKPELLAPAGSLEALKAAIYYGADAVYFGLNGCNAREKAENCADDTLGEWIALCHRHGVKAYLAANILVKERELSGVLNKIGLAAEWGADAFIIQDLGLIREVNRRYPEIAVHLSTQAGVGNVRAVRELGERLKFQRVVLARECSKSEIAVIAGTIETEVFVHGALCVAYSGSCYFSSMLTGNSGNRGRCQQFCRTAFSAGEKGTRGYLLSPKDLCLLGELNELSALGVASLKIEGRMRRPEYVAETVRVYRKALDGEEVTQADLERLKAVYNRGDYTAGYFKENGVSSLIYPAAPGHIGVRAGTVKSVAGRTAALHSTKEVHTGDGFKIFHGAEECGSGVCVSADGSRATLSCNGKVSAGNEARLTSDASRNKELMSFDLSCPVSISFAAYAGKCAKLSMRMGERLAESISPYPVEPSKTSPTNKDTVIRQLQKLSGTGLCVEHISVDIEGRVFLPVSLLNAMRREAAEQLLRPQKCTVIKNRQPKEENSPDNGNIKPFGEPRIAAILSNFNQFHSTMRNIVDDIILELPEIDEATLQKHANLAAESYLGLPYYLKEDTIQTIAPYLKYFKGVYCNNPYAVRLAREAGKEIFIGEMNVANAAAARFWAESGIRKIALSKELNVGEAREAVSAARTQSVQPYLPVYGRTKLMQLNHCPVKTAFHCGCGDCKYSENFALYDRTGKAFPVRRFRVAGQCYFYVLNSAVQNAFTERPPEGFHYLMDVQGHSATQIVQILQAVREGARVQTVGDFTRGHLARGVK